MRATLSSPRSGGWPPSYERLASRGRIAVATFNWHSDAISRATPIAETYRNTQNVRRFFKAQCGEAFKFDRPFMAWMKDGTAKTIGDAADEWRRRKAE
jgi:hypothetical protein